MSFSKRPMSMAALVALVGLTTGLAACGDGKENRSKLLSATRASDLRSSLDAAEQMVDDGDCTGATNTALAFEQKVNALPARLDAGLRDALASGAIRLQRLVAEQCQPVGPTGPTGPTLQAPDETDEDGQGRKGKGKAKGRNKNKEEEIPEEGTTGSSEDSGGATTPEE